MNWFSVLKERSTRKEDVIARAQQYANERNRKYYVFEKTKDSWYIELNPPVDKEYITISPQVKTKEEDYSDKFKDFYKGE